VAVATLPGALIALYGNGVLANDGRIEELNFVAFVASLFQLAGIGALIWLDSLTVATAVWLWAVSVAFPAVLLVPKLIFRPGIARPNTQAFRSLLSTGAKYHLGAVSLALILRVDVLLLGSRVDVAQLGIYSLAVALAELSLVATSATSQVAVQVQIRGEPTALPEFTASVARANGIVALTLIGGLLLVGPWVITWIFGKSYAGVMSPVLALAPGILAWSMINPLAVYAIRLARPGLFVLGTTAGLVVNVLLNVSLIPIWGIAGAAVASSAVYVALFLWFAIWFIRSSHLEARSLLPTLSDLRAGWDAARSR